MRAATLAALMLVAGCSGAGEPGNRGASAEQIREVATATNAIEADPGVAVAIQPLSAAESGIAGPGCRFVRNGETLVIATGGDASARIGGQLRHFVQTAPADASGIFLEDRQLSISIGRIAPTGDAATLRITSRANQAEQSWAGSWSCGE
jgi:hypothetical protein